jgi:hypothetical protein
MTQMTQRPKATSAPDLRLLGHLGQHKTRDPNDPKHAGRVAMLAPTCNLETMTQLT